MQVTHNFEASMTSPAITTISAMQGDGARVIVANLMENANPWLVPDGVTAGLSYELPGRDPGYYDRLKDGTPACAIDGNQVSVLLEPILMARPGPVKASIILRDSHGTQMATFPFHIQVKQVPGMVHGENLEAPSNVFEGKIYYGGPGGMLLPLGLGTGTRAEEQSNGSLLLVADAAIESDPTVPAWAKQPEKPRYTADEVGAVSADMLDVSICGALEEAKASGAFDGAKGDPGEAPVRGVDYWTDADRAAIVAEVVDSIRVECPESHVIYGDVDGENNIVISGELADGVYVLKYEHEDGTVTEIGSFSIGAEVSGEIPLTFIDGLKIDKTTGAETTGQSNYAASDSIEIESGKNYTLIQNSEVYTSVCHTAVSICHYDASGAFVGCDADVLKGGDPGSYTIVPKSSTAKIKLRVYCHSPNTTKKFEMEWVRA